MALQVSPGFKQIVIPKYVDPKTLDPATQPKISAPKPMDTSSLKISQGKVKKKTVLDVIPDAIQKFKDPTGLDLKEKLQENPEDTDSLISASLNLRLERAKSGRVLTPDEENIAKRGAKVQAERDADLVAGFTGGGMNTVGKDVIQKASKEVSTYLKSKVAEKVPIKQKLPEAVYNGWNKFYSSFVDRFKPVTEISKLTQGLKPGENPEVLVRRFLGTKGVAESKLMWKTTSLDKTGNISITGGGLSDAIGSFKNNVDDLETYLIAKRDLELSKRGVPFTTPKASQSAIEALKVKHGDLSELDKVSKDVVDYAKRSSLDPLLEVEAISQELYDKILKDNEFYTPFQRAMDVLDKKGYIPKELDLFTTKQVSLPIDKIVGSTEKIYSPLESLVMNTYKTTAFVEKQRVVNSIIDLRRQSELFRKLIKEVDLTALKKEVDVAALLKDADLTALIKEVEGVGINTITGFKKGVRTYYEVAPELAKVIDTMSKSDVNIWTKILSFPTRVKRATSTLTPEFIARNPIRDQLDAFVYSKYGYKPGVDLISGIFEVTKKSDLYYRWQASGGAQSMFVSLDRIAAQKDLQQVLGKKIRSVNPLNAMQQISMYGEAGTRVGDFKKALKNGATDLEAMFDSRELTLDFGRIGSVGKYVNMIEAFWNANIQGLDKFARAISERPMETSSKAIIGITIPTIGLYMLNKDNPRYQELPQWRKDLFWNIIINEKAPIISIPKPMGAGTVFGVVPEHLAQWMDKNDPEALKSIFNAFGGGVFSAIVPDIAQPIVENSANYSFFRDRPIVSQSISDLPPELQANTYTSETAKEIGKIIKKSPARIENMITGYGTGLARYGLQTSDFILKQLGITNPPTKPSPELSDIPLLRAFIAQEPRGSVSDSVSKFYRAYEKAAQAYEGTKEISNKSVDDGVEYLERNKEALYYKGMKEVANDFSSMRKQKDLILNDDTITPQQKRSGINEIDNLMTEMARQMLTLINESN